MSLQGLSYSCDLFILVFTGKSSKINSPSNWTEKHETTFKIIQIHSPSTKRNDKNKRNLTVYKFLKTTIFHQFPFQGRPWFHHFHIKKTFWKCPVAIHDETSTLSHCQKSISCQQETINHVYHLSWLGCPRHMSHVWSTASTLKRKLVFPDASRDGVTGSVIATRPPAPATQGFPR